MEYQTMMRLLAGLSLALAVCPALARAPSMPASGMIPYRATLVTERLEAVDMERLLLDGERPIQMDPLPGLIARAPLPGQSLSMVSPYNPLVQVNLSVFPSTLFAPELNASVLQNYLVGLQKAAPAHEDFAILLQPEENEGIAEFTYLETRPYTLRYTFTHIDEQERATRMVRQENWSQSGNRIYVLSFEAPERAFDAHYRQVRGAASTMQFVSR